MNGAAAGPAAHDDIRELIRATIWALLEPLAAIRDDPSVSEIMINGHNQIYVEQHEGGVSRVRLLDGATFGSAFELEALARSIAQFAGRRLVADELSIEARLPDGSRVHIVQPPAARVMRAGAGQDTVTEGALCIAIRKFRREHKGLATIAAGGSMSAEMAEFLALSVMAHKNILISGGTGTGKTTLLSALSESFAEDDRVIVIEDVNELAIPRPHVVYFEAVRPDRFGNGGIGIRDLFRASLRMRPDRIIVGECRGEEALDMIQAMSSGHTGSMTTVHANSTHGALARLEAMVMMGNSGIPMAPLRTYIGEAVDLVVQVIRLAGRRLVSEILEVEGVDSAGEYLVRPIFEIAASSDSLHLGGVEHRWTGKNPSFAEEVARIAPSGAIQRSERIWRRS